MVVDFAVILHPMILGSTFGMKDGVQYTFLKGMLRFSLVVCSINSEKCL